MADQQLQINIGANTQQLEAGLKNAETIISRFEGEVKDTSVKLKQFAFTIEGVATSAKGLGPVAFKPASDSFGKLGERAEETGDKLKRLPSASNSATLALSNLGRVASDAPFGFIAISNNIEPLIQSFQSLGRQSGGLGGTLKALGASLAGPGGLLLGFSLVSSAITVAVQKYGSLSNAINALFGNQDALVKQVQDAAKSYEKFNQELKTTQDIQGSAAGSVQGEISRVNALAGIVQDQTKTYQQRNQALKDLQAINKTYFGDIDLEKGKLGELKLAVEAYTQATIQAAVTKGFESEIGRVSVELDKQQRVLDKLIPKLGEAAAAQRKQSQALPGIAQAAEQSRLGTAAIEATDAYIKQNTAVQDLRKQLEDLNTAIGESINRYNDIKAPVEAASDASKKKAEADKEAAKAADKQAAAQAKVNAFQREYNDLVARQEKFKSSIQTVDFVPPDVPEITIPATISATVPQSTLDSFAAFAEQQRKALDVANIELFATLFDKTLSPAIDGAFQALANGTSVIDSIKNSLKGLLAQLAANAAKALLLSAALKFIPGAGALGAAGGGGFGGILSSLLGGGGGVGGFPALRGAAAPSFAGVQGFGGGLQLAGQVVFRQQGSDLVGVLNSSNARINRVG